MLTASNGLRRTGVCLERTVIILDRRCFREEEAKRLCLFFELFEEGMPISHLY